jgi:TP901 family phage tail tape measure protein
MVGARASARLAVSIQAAQLYALVSVAGSEKAVGDLRRVSGQVDQTQGVLNRMSQATSGWAGQTAKGASQMATGLIRVGEKAAVAAVVAGGAAAKIAMDFEDAFAAVEKTVEGTPAELDAIDQALRRLSTNIPVTFQGLATIAAEAGALGVATKDIVRFTEAVARTSAATVGLSEFDASEAFGKLSTIFRLSGDLTRTTTGAMVSDYERLGSALVALGNAGASSEADIIAVTKRFAPAAQQARISAAETLAWSSALASLGPEAEAAGGALQRLLNRAQQNIGLMGEEGVLGKNRRKRVEVFAAVTGMTVDEFVKLFRKDASTAMQRFVEGVGALDPIKQQSVLFQAGIINQRDVLAIQAFIQRSDVLAFQLDLAREAWAKGIELQKVSETRFDTLKAKAIEFKNTILLGAAAVGDGMLPALGRLVAKAKEFVNLHMGDLTTLGQNIGAALDSIDWNAVSKGAETFVGWLQAGYDIVRKIPAEFLVIGGGLSALNKLSGGLLGSGFGNIVAGLGKGVVNVGLNALSMVGGKAGAVIGAATATRVFVVNWPAGFGGGVPPVASGAPAAAAGASAGSIAAAVSIAMIPVAAALAVIALRGGDQIRADDLKARRDTAAARGLDPMGVPTGPRGAPGTGPVNSFVRATHDRLDHAARTLLAAAGSLGGLNRSGSPDDRSEARRDPAKIVGKVPFLAKLDAIGSKDDPFGFKHIKTFAFNQLGKNDPLGLKGELKWHIGEIDQEIADAAAKGDQKTVDKLRETKAALSFLLEQVKAGTFRAGDKAYQGALEAAGASRGTTAAVNNLSQRLGLLVTGNGPRTGEDVRADAFGNGGTSITVKPQPVRLTINERELAYAKVTSDAFIRNTT